MSVGSKISEEKEDKFSTELKSKTLSSSKSEKILLIHKQKYKEAVKRIDAEMRRFNEIDAINAELQSTKIECQKYNYALEREVQNFDCYNATLQVVGDRIVIINMKPIPNDLYVLEADPRAVEKLRLSHIVFELEESIKIQN